MNFNELYKKIYDLDKPVIAECGDMGQMMDSGRGQMPPAHPSMSVNLNAQGMDSIESLLRLMTKVNPDMISQKSAEPALTAVPALPAVTEVPAEPAFVAVPAVPADVAVVALPLNVVAVIMLLPIVIPEPVDN